jgi:NAD dependent epimerase/dehydratase family enzyme
VAIRRPTVLPVPLPALRLVLGNQMVDEAILGDQSVLPRVLLNHSYQFLDSQIEPALDRLLSNE